MAHDPRGPCGRSSRIRVFDTAESLSLCLGMLGFDLASSSGRLCGGPTEHLSILPAVLLQARMNPIWRFTASAALLLLTQGLEPDARGGTACRSIALDPAPGPVVSMAWSRNGEELVIADSFGGRLLRYGNQGAFLGIVGPQKATIGEYRPNRIHLTRKGLLVKSRAYEWFEFDSGFKLLRHIGPDGPPRLAMYDEALSGDELFGFGSVRRSDHTSIFGIHRAKLSSLELIETSEEMPLDSKAGTLYTTLSPEVALAGGVPYALRFGEPSYLLNVRAHQRLKAFPKGFDRLPTLPSVTGPDSDIPRDRILQKTAMPVALYGSGSFLFVLIHRPANEGMAIWELHRIDPVKDLISGAVILPTSVPEIVLAPGKESWAILEKGPLTASGKQEARRLLLVPSAAIEKGSGRISCP